MAQGSVINPNDEYDCTNGTCPFKAPIAIRCDPGYILVGYGIIVCAENGTWHKPLPRCESKSRSVVYTFC